ncbi:MAG: diguanylate cyclase domain-containing protein [Oscillospiraceae bacterium]
MTPNNISHKKLIEIIELQTEVVQQGMDLGSIMNLVVQRAQTIAHADETIQLLSLISELIDAAMFSALKNEKNEVFYKATHDFLTGISNRSLFYDRLRQRLSQAKRKNENFAIIMLDMDGLKQINDGYGHRTGDAAIKEVALRIKNSLRESDTVSRLGGDEFGVIVFNEEDCGKLSVWIERIYAAIARSFTFEEHSVELKVSAGYSVFPQDGNELEALIEKADQLMYEEKKARKGLKAV